MSSPSSRLGSARLPALAVTIVASVALAACSTPAGNATSGAASPTTSAVNGNPASPDPGSTGGSGGGDGGGEAQPTAANSSGIGIGPVTVIPPSIHQALKLTYLSGSGSHSAAVSCPGGEIALGGGWVTTAATAVHVIASKRTGVGAWSVKIAHPSSVSVIAYTECLRFASGAVVTEVSGASLGVSSGLNGHAVSACPSSSYRVGGGFEVASAMRVHSSTPSGAGSWDLMAEAVDVGGSIRAFTECLTYKRVKALSTEFSGPEQYSTSPVTATAQCLVGEVLAGGSFSGNAAPTLNVYTNVATSTNGWKVTGSFTGEPSVKLFAYALCVSF
jgi:hypothetical protein